MVLHAHKVYFGEELSQSIIYGEPAWQMLCLSQFFCIVNGFLLVSLFLPNVVDILFKECADE